MIRFGMCNLAAVAMLALPPATIGLSMAPTMVAAEKGGNGNRGNGRAGRENGAQNERSNARGNNGRGAIASELKGLNAAHASPTALANASADSMPGKLYAYQQSQLALTTSATMAEEAEQFLAALSGMTEEQFIALNPTLDYATTLAQAQQSYLDAQEALAMATTSSETSLMVLTGGRELSDGAMQELNALLGL